MYVSAMYVASDSFCAASGPPRKYTVVFATSWTGAFAGSSGAVLPPVTSSSWTSAARPGTVVPLNTLTGTSDWFGGGVSSGSSVGSTTSLAVAVPPGSSAPSSGAGDVDADAAAPAASWGSIPFASTATPTPTSATMMAIRQVPRFTAPSYRRARARR